MNNGIGNAGQQYKKYEKRYFFIPFDSFETITKNEKKWAR